MGKDIDSSRVIFEKDSQIDSKTDNEADSIVEVLAELFDDMQERPEEKIKTGISIIDKCTNGLGKHRINNYRSWIRSWEKCYCIKNCYKCLFCK